MTLNLKSDLAAALESLAAAQGLSVEDYLQQLVERELPAVTSEPAPSESSGMVSRERPARLPHGEAPARAGRR